MGGGRALVCEPRGYSQPALLKLRMDSGFSLPISEMLVVSALKVPQLFWSGDHSMVGTTGYSDVAAGKTCCASSEARNSMNRWAPRRCRRGSRRRLR